MLDINHNLDEIMHDATRHKTMKTRLKCMLILCRTLVNNFSELDAGPNQLLQRKCHWVFLKIPGSSGNNNSGTLYLQNVLNPQTLNIIWHELLSWSYCLGFKHGHSFLDMTLGWSVFVQSILILMEHYLRTWTLYTTNKKIKLWNSFVQLETWN
jgi:hypothetical protein